MSATGDATGENMSPSRIPSEKLIEELGLISVVDKQFYLTPEGFSLLSHVAIDEEKAMIRSQR
jgi:hypothetical protein